MADWNAEDEIRRLLVNRTDEYVLETGTVWTRATPHPAPSLPDHGWKLHISSRVDALPRLGAGLFPFLLERGCTFKAARSPRVLRRLNGGEEGAGAVGKAVTVYPEPSRLLPLAAELVELLRGHPGPRVLSDRRVAPDAPVYYRYGPFRARWRSSQDGMLVIALEGPEGQEFEAAAGLRYRQPEWVSDPFAGMTDGAAGPDEGVEPGQDGSPVLLGGRYRVVDGLHESPRGNVYRAVDTTAERSGDGDVDGDAGEPSTVVVKTARAHVDEDRQGHDVRVRLRNERRILEACAGVDGIPAFLDHFAHTDDEYLVTTDAGAHNLLEVVWEEGALLPAGAAFPGDDAGFVRLAGDLAGALGALHARGVVMRDVTPRNIVRDADGRMRLIDFGISALDGLHIPGGTAGFAPREQFDRTRDPAPADDHYALGMVLAFAATGLTPVTGDASTELARTRALQSLDALHGEHRPALLPVVEALLSQEPERAADACALLASGSWRTDSTEIPRVVITPVGGDSVAALKERVRELVVAEAGEYHLGGEAVDFPSVDAGVYTGSAGVGLELLHHLDQPGVPKLLERLAAHAHRSLTTVSTAHGLFAGRTGTEIYLAAARRAGVVVPEGALLPPPEVRSSARAAAVAASHSGAFPDALEAAAFDVISGDAGTGLGLLLQADLGDGAALDEAGVRAERLLARSELLAPPADAVADLGRVTTFGYAHGHVGVTDFLLLYAARTDDRAVLAESARRARVLAGLVPGLVEASGAPSATQMAVSWCRGTAGLVRLLRHAQVILDEPQFGRSAESLALSSLPWTSRLSTLGQCCGTAGLGSVLLDMAAHTGDERFLHGAEEAARHLLRRSHGPDERPALVVNSHTEAAPYSWSQGYAGILTFLRRLRDPGAVDVLPEP